MTKPVKEYIVNHLGVEIDHIWRNEKTKFIEGDGTSVAIKRCCSHYNKAMRKISKIGTSNSNTALWTCPFPTASAASSPSPHFRRIDLVPRSGTQIWRLHIFQLRGWMGPAEWLHSSNRYAVNMQQGAPTTMSAPIHWLSLSWNHIAWV